MKAGRVSDDILYVMGIVPGDTTGVSVIGANQSTIYRERPGKIRYFETFSVTGGYSSQVLEITAASREFYPIVMVCKSFTPDKAYISEEHLGQVKVSARIEFCVEMRYVLCQMFWQDTSTAVNAFNDSALKQWGLYTDDYQERSATRHAITFIKRAKADEELRTKAWGDEQLRFGKVIKASAKPVNRGSARPVRRLYLTDGPRERRQAKGNAAYREDRLGVSANEHVRPDSGAQAEA
jgi:hypothetical protein